LKTTHSLFDLNPDGIEARLFHKPRLLEVFAVGLPIAFILGFAYLNASTGMPFASDFNVYMQALDGTSPFYYTYWSLPIFQGLALLPGLHTAYILWCVLNVLGIWFAARVFGGRIAPVLLAYQTLIICYYGQITGITIAGLALLWWSLERRRWMLAGVGAALALIKWQMGIPLCLALLLLADTSWLDRLRTLLVLLTITLISLLVYPGWIITVLWDVISQPPYRFGDISLWYYVGSVALILWLPPLLLPMSRGRRYAALCATTALAMPYFQQTGLLALFVLPLGWFSLLGNLAYLYAWFPDAQLGFMIVVPMLAYLWTVLPPLRYWVTQRVLRAQVATA
jgi:hypothetical protein